MNGHQIDELLKKKVDNARRGRALRTVAAALVLLALIALIASAIHRHKEKAVNIPEGPSTVEAEQEPSPEESEEPTQTKDGQKPLQPEEIRRLQTKHELVFEWLGVPEEEMPPIVTVTVLHQGEEVARFTLSEESEWRHTWSDNYSADTLTLRADLPKSVMASFVLHGNKFTMTGSYGAARTPETDAPEDAAKPEDAETSEESGADAPEAAEQSDPEAQSGSGDEEPAAAAAEETDEQTEDTDEISAVSATGRRWWPIVLLMLCGAVLVTLGMLGTDRRRSR